MCFQEYPNEEKRLTGASRKLLKIAQLLTVKAIPPLSILPDSNRDIMTGLDNIMHCEQNLRSRLNLLHLRIFIKTKLEYGSHPQALSKLIQNVTSGSPHLCFLLEHKLQLHNIMLSPAFNLNLNHNLDFKVAMDHSSL